jgi:hypothetical protein
MLALAGAPVDPAGQAVLFYLHVNDVAALRTRLLAEGLVVSDIGHPDYMSAGEIRMSDPDGYVLLLGQLEKAP